MNRVRLNPWLVGGLLTAFCVLAYAMPGFAEDAPAAAAAAAPPPPQVRPRSTPVTPHGCSPAPRSC